MLFIEKFYASSNQIKNIDAYKFHDSRVLHLLLILLCVLYLDGAFNKAVYFVSFEKPSFGFCRQIDRHLRKKNRAQHHDIVM